MRWALMVLAIGCKGGATSEPPVTGSGSPAVAIATDAAASNDAPAADAPAPPAVSDGEKAMVTALFDKLKAGERPPGVDVGTFARRYEHLYIDEQTAFIAQQPRRPGERVIMIYPFYKDNEVGGPGYTQDLDIEMTFDTTGALIGLTY